MVGPAAMGRRGRSKPPSAVAVCSRGRANLVTRELGIRIATSVTPGFCWAKVASNWAEPSFLIVVNFQGS